MASGGWIESVYTLTSLPAPPNGTSGRITASAVCSLAQGKKRKRLELVTAIDGESLNIYGVENSNLITTYAVSSDTSFDAPPCSLYVKREKSDLPRRLTYAAHRTSTAPKTVQLSCHEAASQESGYTASKPTVQALASAAKVVLTDVLPAHHVTQEDDAPHDVLTLQQDGQLTAFPAKLGQPLWSARLSALVSAADGFDLPEDVEIRHAELVPLEAASKGILSGRQDVVAAIDTDNVGWTYILTVVTTSASIRHTDVLDVDMHIYALRASLGRNSASSKPQQLLSWSLPQAVKRKTSHVLQHHLDSKSGSLLELIDGKIINYDLTGLSPKVVDAFQSSDKFDSVIKLSPTNILSASATKLTVYDSKYGSQLVTQELPPPSAPKKGKATTDDAPLPPLQFIDHFRSLGYVIALRGVELVVVQTGDRARSSKRKKSGTLLIDSLGKGRLDSRLRSVAHSSDATKKKKKAKIGTSALFTSPDLDALLEQDDVDGFERRFAALVGFTIARPPKKNEAEPGSPKPSEISHNKWNFPKPSKIHRQSAQRPQALYALSKIFEATPAETPGAQTSSVQLRFYPENIFLWLVHTGQLRADTVQRALEEYQGVNVDVATGDIIQALADFTGDLSLINYVLEYHTNLHVDEVVVAIKVIIMTLDNETLPQPEHKLLMDSEFARAAASTGALTGGVGLSINVPTSDVLMLDGASESKPEPEAEAEVDMESITEEAMIDVDEILNDAYESLDALPIRGETLRQAFTRLNALPRDSVIRTLRAKLTQHELIFLIHILRIELDQGGWTTRYSDREDIEDEPSSSAITVITSLLNATVDAIGMRGWLTTSGPEPFDSIDETLRLLRGEISNTLEGVHEATYTAGVLGEFRRYCYRLDKDPAKDSAGYRKDKTWEQTVEHWKRGQTVVVEDAPSSRLPMGLGIENARGVRTTVDKSGVAGKGKTAADVGREIRRGLPAYVFERIRF